MNVVVHRLNPVKPTLNKFHRGSGCIKQAIKRVCYSLVTTCGLLMGFFLLDLFVFIEYITFPFTQHGFVHGERKKLKSKKRKYI